jgi:exo-poly-alpha-galacturonosidase
LTDGTEITSFNFTKGNDGWDPLPGLIEKDLTKVSGSIPESKIEISSYADRIFIKNVNTESVVNIYNTNGVHYESVKIYSDFSFSFEEGFWIVNVRSADGIKTVKLFLH